MNGGVFFSARELHNLMPFHLTLKAAMELNVFDILTNFGSLSSEEIILKIPTTITNPNASAFLERILKTLASYGILTLSRDQNDDPSIYGLSEDFRCLAQSPNPQHSVISTAANVISHSLTSCFESFDVLKCAVLEDKAVPFVQAFQMDCYEYNAKDPKNIHYFSESMANNSKFYVSELLKSSYKGFEDVKELMDVGGFDGTLVSEVVAKYPHIRGMNFDLPYVIDLPGKVSGVEHVAGNMFESLPNAQTIMTKCVVYNWDDDQCKKLLTNCWNALPKNGKVIVLDFAIPRELKNDVGSRTATMMDIKMMVYRGAKVRTVDELDKLGKDVGFVETKMFPVVEGFHVVEFIK